jgi:hypothetical protein
LWRAVEVRVFSAPSGFRTPDPLIKRGQFWLLPAVSGCVPYSVGRQCFAYLITSCRSRLVPADCVSFAAHKRHLAVFTMANLLPRRAGDAVWISWRTEYSISPKL